MKKLLFPLIFLALGYFIFFFIFNKKKVLQVFSKEKTQSSRISEEKVESKKSVDESQKKFEEEKADEEKTFNPLKEKKESASTAAPSEER